MKRALGFGLALFVMFATAALAEDRGTPDEAKGLALKAIAILKEAGPEKTFTAITAKGGPFHDRDLYCAAFDNADGKLVNVANGFNPAFIGKDVIELADVEGFKFGRAFAAVSDVGWVTYKWLNPQTKLVEKKKTFLARSEQYVVACGAYTD